VNLIVVVHIISLLFAPFTCCKNLIPETPTVGVQPETLPELDIVVLVLSMLKTPDLLIATPTSEKAL